ncbi:lipase family protein [Streptomyces albidoflavus]
MPSCRVPRRRVVAALVATCAAITVTVPSGGAVAAGSDPEVRQVRLPDSNGDVISSEPGVFPLDPLKAMKVDAKVQRVTYRTTDRTGMPIAVTGTVLVPNKAHAAPRPIIGFAPGTQGLADKRAPSRQPAEGTEYEALPVKGLLDEGYAVVVTDYQGLGTPGAHTYMDREAQGRAVLDSLRAAQRLDAAGLPDAGPVALYGSSQGGASASATELAPTYAPELKIRGAVAGTPPADWCRRGATEKFSGNHVPGDIAATVATSSEGRPWLADRFAGRSVPSTC